MQWTDTPFIQWHEIGQFEFEVLVQNITITKRTEIGLFDDMAEYENFLESKMKEGWVVVVQSERQPNPLRWQKDEDNPPAYVRRILLLARPITKDDDL